MRFVIYDDETLEPITVVNIAGFTERDIVRHGRRYRIPVPERFEISLRPIPDAELAAKTEIRIVELVFEPISRGRDDSTIQRGWLCFTKAADLAMLLTPDWLPGQRSAVNYLQEQNDRLTSMLMRALS